MKSAVLSLTLVSTLCFGQHTAVHTKLPVEHYVRSVNHLTLEAALELTNRVSAKAASLDKKVSIAVLDASGSVVVLTRGDGVGPHNTEAARRKAFTALSTKTSTLVLLRNAAQNHDTANLNTLPELLLLSGGTPIWFKGEIIGSVGVAGGGSPENDDLLARAAALPELGISTTK